MGLNIFGKSSSTNSTAQSTGIDSRIQSPEVKKGIGYYAKQIAMALGLSALVGSSAFANEAQDTDLKIAKAMPGDSVTSFMKRSFGTINGINLVDAETGKIVVDYRKDLIAGKNYINAISKEHAIMLSEKIQAEIKEKTSNINSVSTNNPVSTNNQITTSSSNLANINFNNDPYLSQMITLGVSPTKIKTGADMMGVSLLSRVAERALKAGEAGGNPVINFLTTLAKTRIKGKVVLAEMNNEERRLEKMAQNSSPKVVGKSIQVLAQTGASLKLSTQLTYADANPSQPIKEIPAIASVSQEEQVFARKKDEEKQPPKQMVSTIASNDENFAHLKSVSNTKTDNIVSGTKAVVQEVIPPVKVEVKKVNPPAQVEQIELVEQAHPITVSAVLNEFHVKEVREVKEVYDGTKPIVNLDDDKFIKFAKDSETFKGIVNGNYIYQNSIRPKLMALNSINKPEVMDDMLFKRLEVLINLKEQVLALEQEMLMESAIGKISKVGEQIDDFKHIIVTSRDELEVKRAENMLAKLQKIKNDKRFRDLGGEAA